MACGPGGPRSGAGAAADHRGGRRVPRGRPGDRARHVPPPRVHGPGGRLHPAGLHRLVQARGPDHQRPALGRGRRRPTARRFPRGARQLAPPRLISPITLPRSI
ncbi:hypothetical protein ACFFX0_09570 [Citricoccus parietis]|uniref:Uncharacterized protein n=1 Tax=Citricoccus parietis TaxID=592307 RepID=A0ABV5FXK9_9MICC